MGVPREQVERLYEEFGPALLAYARSIVHDAAEAEDALQQVFLKLIAGRGLVVPREPRPYLFRAVRNTCLNQRRSTRRAGARAPDTEMFVAPAGLDGLAAQLDEALNELPEEQRETVMLRVWGELTLDEAAQVLGIPLNTVASRYRYALRKLRQRFKSRLGS